MDGLHSRHYFVQKLCFFIIALLHISYDDLLRDMVDNAGVLNSTTNIPAHRVNASGVSADPQLQGLVYQVHYLNRRDLITPAAPSPGASSPVEPLPGAASGASSGGASPPSGGRASPGIGGIFPAPVAAAARKRTAKCNNSFFSVQRRSVGYCRGADGSSYPLQGSMPQQQQRRRRRRRQQQQQQLRGSGRRFPAEYATRATITRPLQQQQHAGYCGTA